MKIYDITAEISENLPSYGGKGRPTVTELMQLKNGDFYNFSQLKITTHTGTHADVPLHFIDGGAACDDISLEHFYGRAKVFDIPATSHICKSDLAPLNIEEGDIILLNTGQSHYMRQAEFNPDYFALTKEAAEYLVEKKIKTVGIDYLSVDAYDATDFPAHMALLGNNIATLEGLVLENVPEGTYTLSALPLKIPGGNGSPVRAVLVQSQ
ncbi:MAG: cyclase family protein [Defluviitaleaceae bacterium]|nr:cyclase family protein [Defluviitaleaceae bacterium]